MAADAQDVANESSEASWVPVGTAVEQAQRGERKVLPPTMMTLASLLPFSTVAEVLEASESRSLDAVRPEIKVNDDGSVGVALPDGTFIAVPPGMFR